MTKIVPYLNFPGSCEEAFNFYRSVFGGEAPAFMRYKDAGADMPMPADAAEKVLHVALPIGPNYWIYGSDRLPEMGDLTPGNNIELNIEPASEAEADHLFNKLALGGTVHNPMAKTFWNAYWGSLTDQYGIRWMVNFNYSPMA